MRVAKFATPLFGLVIFSAAALLFAIQPMVAKNLLPEFGGSSRVWLISLFFFQAALLLGYSYAHFSHAWLGRKHIWLHLVLAALVVWWLPLETTQPDPSLASPSLQLLAALGLSVGFPFFVLSATSPLVQAWWSQIKGGDQEPYFLYSASNAGSLLALLAYPFLLELWFPISAQMKWWSWAFGIFGAFLVAAALLTARASKPVTENPAGTKADVAAKPGWSARLGWILLAALPSSLLQSVTLYFSTDLAAAPLLWVLPLAIYLITFIIAFGRFDKTPSALQVRITGFALILSAALLLSETYDPAALLFAVYAITLFLAALLAHQKLANARPQPRFLTEYYLWISLGGVVGGALNAFVAPLVFNDVWEFPLGLALAGLVVAGKPEYRRNFFLLAAAPALMVIASRFLFADQEEANLLSKLTGTGIPLVLIYLSLAIRGAFGPALGLWMLASILVYVNPDNPVLTQERGFFGVHRVIKNESLNAHDLQHGTTLHGRELQGELATVPSTYYHLSSPLAELLVTTPKPRWGIVGLGAGSLSAYLRPGEHLTYFEIDPIVADLATNERYFGTLQAARKRGTVEIELGDARLTLAAVDDQSLSMLLIDAFSSDSIPLHLVTLDALDLYAQKIEPDGLLVFHISNQYIDLRGVLARIALERGWQVRFALDAVYSQAQLDQGKIASGWMAISMTPEAEQKLNAGRWLPLAGDQATPLWTDDKSSLLQAIDIGWMDRAALKLSE